VRLALNAAFLARPLTGSGRYVHHLVLELGRLDPDLDLRCFGQAGSPPAGSLPTELGWRALGSPFVGGPLGRLGARAEDLSKVWFEQLALPLAARAERRELLHYPYFAAPLASAIPVAVTVHDLIPVIDSRYRTSALFRLYVALAVAGTRRARLILTDSVASRADVIGRLGVAEERVRVVYLAADERFAPTVDAAELAAFRARLGLPDKYLLYLGGHDYRKNVIGLLEAFALAWGQGLRLPLVVAGRLPKPGPLFPDLPGAVERLGLRGQVLFPGPGDDADTPRLYQAATAFVFPSTYEGFGLPPLEAMACGTPVVCSSASSLPEVVGDAAISFEPTDCLALATALLRVATDAELRADLRERGLARAAQFSWRKCAAETLAAYREVIPNSTRQGSCPAES